MDHPLAGSREAYLQQAYEHYRHLEVIRIKYITWFYSLVLGALAFAGALLGTESSEYSSKLELVYIFASSALILYGFVTQLQVIATQSAIDGYSSIVDLLLVSIFGQEEADSYVNAFATSRTRHLHKSISLRLIGSFSRNPTSWINRVIVGIPVFLLFCSQYAVYSSSSYFRPELSVLFLSVFGLVFLSFAFAVISVYDSFAGESIKSTLHAMKPEDSNKSQLV